MGIRRGLRVASLLLGVAVVAAAGGGTKLSGMGKWYEVDTPHFVVVTDGSGSDARRVGERLERMRLAFKALFPDLSVDPPLPVTVLALKDRDDLRTILPKAYLKRGQADVAGITLQLPGDFFIGLRLDVIGGRHPYETVYHEYTHVLIEGSLIPVPVWLNEGLAQYYQETTVSGNGAILGEPNDGALEVLRRGGLIPLPVLFKVDAASKYYHREDEVSRFYAESWVLTHFLMSKQLHGGKPLLSRYLALLEQHVDAVTAARRAFGDLSKLEVQLGIYVRDYSFTAIKVKFKDAVEVAAARELDPGTGESVRADYTAMFGRPKEAGALMRQVLKVEPDNEPAMEILGETEEDQGHWEVAQQWCGKAVATAPTDHEALVCLGMSEAEAKKPDNAKAEANLEAAIKAQPGDSQPYWELARVEMREADPADAHRNALQAVELAPWIVPYRLQVAQTLADMGRFAAARSVVNTASKLAMSAGEVKACQDELKQIAKQAAKTPAAAPAPAQ